MCVPRSAVEKHRRHGDRLGRCHRPGDDDDDDDSHGDDDDDDDSEGPRRCPDGKVPVCHRPGNPRERRTLCVPKSEVDRHLKHGDRLGVCRRRH